jgi:hypothetical protein
MDTNRDMTMSTRTHRFIPVVATAVAIGATSIGLFAYQAAAPAQASKPAAPAATAAKTYATPEKAVEAVIVAASQGPTALLALLGPEAKDLINSGDAVQDQKDREDFIRLAREKVAFAKDPADATHMKVLIGRDAFPTAIPLVGKAGAWSWDVEGGKYEVLVRHVGANELDTIAVCRGYVEAQMSYALMDPNKSGVHQYAQRIISTPGKKDGLYWPSAPNTPDSPVSEAIARAIAEGYTSKSEPYHGYYYKVLTAQGASAPLGAMDFVVQGHMIGGFALVAWPAKYRVTGVKTFMVGANGVVYEKDLGANTATLAAAITKYDPDKTWTVTNDNK